VRTVRVVTAQFRQFAVGLLLGVAVMLTACSSTGPIAAETPTAVVSSPRPTEVATNVPIPDAFVRSCATSVFGDLGRGWRSDDAAAVVGPLALLYPGAYADEPKAWFARHDGAYRSQKVLAVIKQGSVVTVAIAPSARGAASLLYDPGAFWQPRGYEVSDGERAVTFEACSEGEASLGPAHSATQFNGGFIVAGSGCVALTAWVGDSAPRRIVLSFGAGECAGDDRAR
jgi:hypothetical protein